MDDIKNIMFSGIMVIFPIMVYLIICCYLEIKKQKYTRQLIIITSFTSLYLCTKCNTIINDSLVLMLFNIPLIIMYIKKEPHIAIVESVLIIIYANIIGYNCILLLIKYTLYFLIYKIQKNKESNIIIKNIALIEAFFLSFELFLYNPILNYKYIINIFIIMIIIYVFSFISVYLFILGDKVTLIYKNLKNLEKEKQLKDALFKLTHEIKNPLAVCKGYLDMLDLNDKTKTLKYINIIKDEIDRSLNIMNDFLVINKIKINKEEMDPYLLLEDVYNSFKIILNNKKIKVNQQINDEEIYINADYERLKQVLLNLLKNSSEAITKTGEINIRGYNDKKNIYIEVSDTGKGMSEEELTKIKDMFYTTKERGNGIGVSLSNEIIKAHDGKLDYTSILNKGTTAKITIPL